MSAKTGMLSVTPAPEGKPGGPGLWDVRGMQLPPYFQNIRNALQRAGHSDESAYRITWGAIRRWASGSGNVHPEVRAAARKALAQLSEKQAEAHAHSNTISAQLELAGVWRGLGRGKGWAYVGPQQAQGPVTPALAKAKAAFTSYNAGPATAGGRLLPPGQRKEEGQDRLEAMKLRAQATKLRAQAHQALMDIRQLRAAIANTKKAAGAAAAGRAAGKGFTSGKTHNTRSGGSKATKARTGKFHNFRSYRSILHQQQVRVAKLVTQRNGLLQQATTLDAQAAKIIAQ